MDLIEKLREKIEVEYHDALAALETLEKYLTKQNHSNIDVPNQSKRPPRKAARKKYEGEMPIRQRVLKEVQEKWMSVAEVAAITGLERVQIRGTLQAVDIRGFVQKRVTQAGVKEYLYAPPQSSTQEPTQETANGKLEESLA